MLKSPNPLMYWPNSPILFNFFMLLMMALNILASMTSNLIYLWILLEINFMIFIFLYLFTCIRDSMVISFFLIQSIPSLILLYLININSILISKSVFTMMFYLTMTFKLGLFPFIWWPPMILKNMNWMLIFTLSTLQKFIPFLMIKYFFILNPSNLLIIICLMSLIISTMMAIYSNNMKMIFAYSSINNSSWMILLILTDYFSFIMYFIIYSFLFFLYSYYLNQLNINSMMDFYLFAPNKNKIYYLLFMFFLLFSFSMIPPLMSFILKVNSSMNLIFMDMYIYTMILMLCSTLSIIMYISIMFKIMIFYMNKPKFLYNTPIKTPLIISTTTSIFLFLLIILMGYMLI